VKAGSYDPTLVDVELTAEEAKTRANRRDAFREHLRATLAEKELVGAFAKMYRMNEKPKDPLQWLLDYFERDQREHIRRAEETAETYRSELLRAEQERDSLIAKMEVMRQKVSNLERTVQELRDGGRKHVVGVYGGEEMPTGADAPAPAEKENDKKEKKEKKEKESAARPPSDDEFFGNSKETFGSMKMKTTPDMFDDSDSASLPKQRSLRDQV